MVEFQKEHPEYGAGLLSFTLEYVLVSNWPTNSLMKEYNNCPYSCTLGGTCACTCTTDLDDWSEHEVVETNLDDLFQASYKENGTFCACIERSMLEAIPHRRQGLFRRPRLLDMKEPNMVSQAFVNTGKRLRVPHQRRRL